MPIISIERTALDWCDADYVNSLDAAAQVERIVPDHKQRLFANTLVGLIVPDAAWWYEFTVEQFTQMVRATADQRCHAAMLALGYVEE